MSESAEVFKKIARPLGLTVPALLGGALGGLGGWWFKEEIKKTVSSDSTSWVLPVAGTFAGLGVGFYLGYTGILRLQ